ncbi:MAG: hypothetical protein JXB26_08335 [Candidatus Aminicenantes bacterium]|nr:hypothetical protein [Candidatus Aminicenantes bacterium]
MLKFARIILPVFLFFFLLLSVLSIETTIDKSKIPRLKWMGPGYPGTYEEYLATSPGGPHYLREVKRSYKFMKDTSTERLRILIFVNSTVYPGIAPKISRYAASLEDIGYEIKLYTSFGGTPEAVKSIIQNDSDNLLGCVFIGTLPAAWYEIPNDYESYGYAEFPCDLFFMDLDGKWEDTDVNGKYDIHQDGYGDRKPEIFIGRIDASQMPGNEIAILNAFFDKDNDYWTGNFALLRYGLTYTEDDWATYNDFRHDISFLYSNYEAVWAPSTNRDDYLNHRLKSPIYEFIQLACHSSSSGHYFTRGGWLLSDTAKNAPPKGLGYNLFCCSSLRYTDPNYLGGAYIFNNGEKALAVIGSTKTGSMLEFEYFYKPLGQNNPIGFAFNEWFEMIAPYDKWDVYWHYGMTITGDPLLTFLGVIYPPQHFSGSKEINRSLSQEENLIVLNWNANPKNQNLNITGYRIYQQIGSQFEYLADVSSGITEYWHRNLDKNKIYTYAITAENAEGAESLKVYTVIQ